MAYISLIAVETALRSIDEIAPPFAITKRLRPHMFCWRPLAGMPGDLRLRCTAASLVAWTQP